jgi:predicted TIM-barrel fold metal-dependent hydrolase
MSDIKVIDFHTHAFPDALAEVAIPALEAEAPGITAFRDGKIASLLSSMDNAGIAASVICSIATNAKQTDSIIKWSHEIASERIIPFPSFHPSDPDFAEHVKRISDMGFKGVKFHPYYQDFYLSEERMNPVYEVLEAAGLVVVMHTGYDIAFERIRRCDPKQVVQVSERFPQLKLVSTHLGAWEQWDEVREMIIGKNIYMELSFATEFLGLKMKEFLEAHPSDYILFGTDSPWTDQRATLDAVKALGLDKEVEDKLLYKNAQRLLGK